MSESLGPAERPPVDINRYSALIDLLVDILVRDFLRESETADDAVEQLVIPYDQERTP